MGILLAVILSAGVVSCSVPDDAPVLLALELDVMSKLVNQRPLQHCRRRWHPDGHSSRARIVHRPAVKRARSL